MGIRKQYLRYNNGGTFGVLSSGHVIHCIIGQGNKTELGRFIGTSAAEHVIIWDMKLSQQAALLSGENSAVSKISSRKEFMAVGYFDGTVQIYSLVSAELKCVLAGHKSAVTALSFDDLGHKLFSGSLDTDVIAWDVVAENGIARLSGHKDAVTDICYIESRECVISCSKDSFVKFWDLKRNHCFKTLSGHRSEIWACVLMKSNRYLITGCSDQALKVWKLRWKDEKDDLIEKTRTLAIAELEDSEEIEDDPILQCHLMGTLLRGGRGRVVSLVSDPEGKYLACHGTDTLLEMFMFCSDTEAQTRQRKRLKKLKKEILATDDVKEETDLERIQNESLTLSDEVKRLTSSKMNQKMKSIDILVGLGNEVRLAVGFGNNSMAMYSVKMVDKETKYTCLRELTSFGHQTELRCVAFSSDNLAIVSGSSDSIKIWNRPSQACLRTVATGAIISICFVPGDRHVLAGLQDGRLLIVDIAAGEILEEVPAHTAEVWSVGLLPDQHGCVTGSGDKTVKIWSFELIADTSKGSKARVLSLLHKRTLQLEEAVLCVKISSNSKFIAVGLLDSTVKIFFLDSFKFYLSLYGHKMPVLCLDISDDSALIATGSADRNIKIWGMDFGDCHKSIFAHDDSVTGLQFIPKTHYIFTCGKDGKVKQWDGDTFEKINTLKGHIGESRCLSVAPSGLWAVTCGSDKTMRIWERTDEPLVIGDMDDEMEEELVTGERAPLPSAPNLNIPSKKTVGSEKAADAILECLETCAEYLTNYALNPASVQIPVLMQAYDCTTPNDYLMKTFKRIRSSDLEETLILLPFKSVCEIIKMLPDLLKRNDSSELICKVTLFLIKIHHSSIVASHELLKDIIVINKLIVNKVDTYRDKIGYNLHALQWHQRDIEAAENEALFKDVTKQQKKKSKRKKQRENLKRSIVVIS